MNDKVGAVALTLLVAVLIGIFALRLPPVWRRRHVSAPSKEPTNEMEESTLNRQITVVLRGPSAAVFSSADESPGFRIDRWESELGLRAGSIENLPVC